MERFETSEAGRDLQSLTAEELAARVQEGSQAEYTVLVNRFGPRLYSYFNHRIGNREDCEDLVQDTFLKAFQNIGRYDRRLPFATWLYTIGTRRAVDFYRSRKNRMTVPITEEVPTAGDPHESAVRSEERRNLWVRARALPRKQYDALWLRYAEDMSVKDIARAMGITRVHAKVLLYRGRVRLAREQRLHTAGGPVPESGGVMKDVVPCRSARNIG